MISRKLLLAPAAILILTLTLAACDSSATPTPAGNPPPAKSDTPVSQQVTPAPQSPIIAFSTTGGIAGVQKLLEVVDGKAKYKDGKTTKTQDLPAGTFDTLMQQVNTSDFYNLKDTYDKGGVADDIYYTITVRDGTKAKTIKVAQVGGKDITPKPLQDLITKLNDIQSTLEK